ncbi:hypothetical protein ACQSSU_12745 [Micromonospora echinospora]
MQLELFAAKRCLCLHGDQGAPDRHDGPCCWVCLACDDRQDCDTCRIDLLLAGRDPVWNASLGRPVVTIPTLYGLLDGPPGWHHHIWSTRPDGRQRLVVTNIPRHQTHQPA